MQTIKILPVTDKIYHLILNKHTNVQLDLNIQPFIIEIQACLIFATHVNTAQSGMKMYKQHF
jgi:hypothetical protein